MSRSEREYFEELLSQVPDDVARLVDRQMEIAVAISDAIADSHYITRKEFAAAIEMKPSMLSRILAGNVNLTLKTITKIESALGIDIVTINLPKSVQEKQFVVESEAIDEYFNYSFSELSVQYRKHDMQVQLSEISVKDKMIDYNIHKMGYYEASA
ncbi:MAG: helix-turn-helix transcriptional regulator [Syntrophaceae bacterium]|nr:helix-turn-helix transcriptional regulator [Syntrophaceae bacterium]